MKTQKFAIALVSGALVFGAAQYVAAQGAAMSMKAPKSAKVDLKDAKGESVGTATLTAAKTGVNIALDLKNLPAGVHGIHIHQVAKCEAPAFTTAGGHFNPDSKKHGLQSPDGPHAGDMMNITVKANGTLKTTITDERVTLASGTNSVFANGGTALVIHATADDMKTDPSGNSGARIACGTITN